MVLAILLIIVVVAQVFSFFSLGDVGLATRIAVGARNPTASTNPTPNDIEKGGVLPSQSPSTSRLTVTSSTTALPPIGNLVPRDPPIPDFVNGFSVEQWAFMNLDPTLLQSANITLILPFANGPQTLNLEREDILFDQEHPDDFTWVGHMLGDETSSAIIVYQNGLFTANFSTAVKNANGQYRVYSIIPYTVGRGIAVKSDSTLFPFLLDVPLDVQNGKPVGQPEGTGSPVSVESLPISPIITANENSASFAGTPVIIDVMVVYTNSTMNAFGPTPDSIKAVISLWGAQMNQALTRSKTNTQIRIVHAYNTPTYDDQWPSALTNLQRFANPNDGYMDEVKGLRTYYGVDLSILLTHGEPQSLCGLAYIPQSPFVSPAPSSYATMTTANSPDGELECGNPSVMPVIFSHELGHEMGMHHDPANANGHGVFSYSYGYQNKSGYCGMEDRFRTLMAYECSGLPCPPIFNYSNPHVGIDEGGGVTCVTGTSTQNNAETLTTWVQLKQKTWGELVAAISPTSSNPPSPPLPPVNVSATDGTIFNRIVVTWENSSNSTGYDVYRKDPQTGSWNKIGSSSTTSFSDNTVSPNILYDYYVKSKNGGGTSANSTSDSGYVLSSTSPPLPPLNVWGAYVTQNPADKIDLTWDSSPNPNVTAYEIYLTPMANATGCVDYLTTVGNVTSTSINGITLSQDYTISMKAVNPYGKSQCALSTIGPGIPSGLKTGNNGVSIGLHWNQQAPVEYFKVYRANQPGQPINQAAMIGTSNWGQYEDYQVTLGNAYYYRVSAMYKGVEGNPSSEVMGFTLYQPTGFSAQSSSSGIVSITYSDSQGAMGYIIYRNQTGLKCKGDRFLTTSTSYDDKGLTTGDQYYYSAKAFNQYGYSACTNAVHITVA